MLFRSFANLGSFECLRYGGPHSPLDSPLCIYFNIDYLVCMWSPQEANEQCFAKLLISKLCYLLYIDC